MTSRLKVVRAAAGLALAGAGVALVARAYKRRKRGVQFFRSVTVAASPDAVYDFWARFDNFPVCFSPVKDVRQTGHENEWRWTIAGTDGAELSWNAWVTESIPGKALAWESAPGSRVRSAGVVQFTESGPRSTRVDIRMSYQPAGLREAKTLSGAFGPDPRSVLDECLSRLQARFDEDGSSGNNAR